MKSFSLSRIPWATLGRQEAFSEISAKAEAQKPRVRLMTRQPLFTIVTQATGVTSPLLESLLAQSYSFWELIVVGSAPVHSDMRVRQTSARGDSEGECFETGRRQAKGDWVGFLSPNEILSPAALFTFATEAERQPVRDVLYSHEVHLSTDYSHIDRFYSKGEYSWFNLIHFNCLGRGWFIRCSTLEKVNFEPEAFEADLFLKISEETENWGLIPSYLCYRRGVDPKSLERDGSHLFAVGSHIARRRYSGTAVVRGGRTLVTPLKEKSHLISVIICFRNKAEWTIQCLRSLAGVHSRSPLQVVLLNNRSDHEARARVKVEAVTLGLDFEFVDDAREFNFGQMHNDAVARVARGDILFFLNNDAFLDETVSLDDMVAWTAQDGIGVVGMALRYPDGRPQHTGFQATYGGENRMARVGHDHSQNIFAGLRR
ncbi:MAG: glycosyltransferase [Deltaproteobacteria bacterium]|nr:glycosyltransferase [Deltaproteobacteria bacterium]